MTRNRDLDYSGLAAPCRPGEHVPGIPVTENGEIVYWLCIDCGEPVKSNDVKTGRTGEKKP